MITHSKRLLLALTLLLPTLAHTAIDGFNTIEIGGNNHIGIFYDQPQERSKEMLLKEIAIDEVQYSEGKTQRVPLLLKSEKSELSEDGYRLSYGPLPEGSYYISSKEGEIDEQILYIGTPTPHARIQGVGPLLPIAKGVLPIEVEGTSAVDIEFFSIDDPTLFFEEYYLGDSLYPWQLNRLGQILTSKGLFRYDLPKTQGDQRFSLPIDPTIKAGIYLIAVTPVGVVEKEPDLSLLFLTDIGLHARRYPNETLIIANRLSTAKPLSNAVVEIWQQKEGQMVKERMNCSLNGGLCRIPRALEAHEIIAVAQGNDYALLPMREVPLDLNEYPTSGTLAKTIVAHLSSNRQLYHRGEQVTLNILLRDHDGGLLPPQPIELLLRNPQGTILLRRTLTDSTLGHYQTMFELPEEAPLGRWNLEVRTDPNQEMPNGTLSLYIEDFLPEQMALTILSSKERSSTSEPYQAELEGRYLYGAPAANNRVEVSSRYLPLLTPFPQQPNWYVGGLNSESERYFWQQTDEERVTFTLDNNGVGRYQESPPADLPNNLIVRAHLRYQLYDGGLPSLTRSRTHDFWPHKTVPVVAPQFEQDDLRYGHPAKFQLTNLTQEGELAPSPLLFTLRYSANSCLWIHSIEYGWRCVDNPQREILHRQKITPEALPYHFSVEPNFWGEYQVELTNLDNQFTTTYTFSANGGFYSSDGQLPATKPKSLNIRPDQLSYQLGEKMNVTLDLPFDGELLLLVEADQPLYNERYSVTKGRQNFTIPLSELWNRHDLYLSALLIGNDDTKTLQRAFGLTPIRLDRTDRRLEGALILPEKTDPNDPLIVELQVDNPNEGEQIYATLSITDQGILALEPETPLTAFEAFFGQKRYNIDLIDLYGRLYRESTYRHLSQRFGGDGDLEITEAEPLEAPEKINLSLTSPLIALDKSGYGRYQFRLPPFTGQGVVVAELFSQQRVGEIRSATAIHEPIIAQVTLPPHLRPYEQSQIRLMLRNSDAEMKSLHYRLESPLLEKPLIEEVELPPFGHLERTLTIEYPLIGHEGSDLLPFTLTYGEVGKATSRRHYSLPLIGTFERPITLTKRDQLTSNRVWRKPDALRNQLLTPASETIRFSTQPIIDLRHATDALFNTFRYETAYYVGRLYPWFVELEGEDNPLEIERQRFYQQEIARLAEEKPERSLPPYDEWRTLFIERNLIALRSFRETDGLYKRWTLGQSDYAATSAVLDLLYHIARQAPQLLSEEALKESSQALKEGLTRLNQALRHQRADGAISPQWAEKYRHLIEQANQFAYSSWILAREGVIFNADLRELNQVAPYLSPLGRSYLGAANIYLGNEKEGETLLSHLSPEPLPIEPQLYTISETLDLIQQLAERINYLPDADYQELLLQQLQKQLISSPYLSQQEELSLLKLASRARPEEAIEVLINGEPQLITTLTEYPAEKWHTIESSHPLHLYYQVTGEPKRDGSLEEKRFNVTLKQEYLNLERSLEGDALPLGSRLLTLVTVTPARDLDMAQVTVEIPSGFRLLNKRNPDIKALIDTELMVAERPIDDEALLSEQFHTERYQAVIPMRRGVEYRFAFLMEAMIPGHYPNPAITVEELEQPMIRATTIPEGALIIAPLQINME